MTPKAIFMRTMPFVWAKLILGAVWLLATIILFAIFALIGLLFESGGVLWFLMILWLGIVGAMRYFLMHYIGYLIKAGHIAVVTEAISTGRYPKQQLEYGKRVVKERFATSNVYFVLDKLIGKAVSQIQGIVQKAGKALDIIPGASALTGLINAFIKIYLGYIDECCLGYTFYRKKQNAYKSAADGVVIYAQNWKKLLKDAAKTTGLMVAAVAGVTLILVLLLGLIAKAISVPGVGFVAFIVACMIAWAVKDSFIDSYIMIRVMSSYMRLAPETRITFDLYDKFCRMSSSLKELFQKGRARPGEAQPDENAPRREYNDPSEDDAGEERPRQMNAAPRRAYRAQSEDTANTRERAAGEYAPRRAAPKPVYCAECGAQNAPGVRFCAECGAQIAPRAPRYPREERQADEQ